MIDNRNKMLLCGLILILLEGQRSRAVLAEQIVESPRPASTVSMQLPDENKYDTDLSITRLDISLRTDFESNTVDTVVKASVENFSENTVDRAEFLLCPGMNYSDLSAEIKHIYLLHRNVRKDVKHNVRSVDDNGGKEWDIYIILFERPVRPGEKFGLEFDYTMKGKPDQSSAPICQSKEGLKELFLKGDDWFWCPELYVKSKPNVRPRTYRPSWKLSMEYPAGYVAVADGDPVRREERDGVVKEEWKSLMNGIPYVFINKYMVQRRSERGVTLEVYAPDEELLKKGAERLDDYAKILNLYVELYGHPGSSVYRIVGSSALEGRGGMSTVMGQVVSMHSLDDTSLIAHEMAHTWWGKLIDNYGEGTKFLSEAMAEFSSRYVRRRLGEENCLGNNWIHTEKRRYFCPDFAVSDTWKWPPLIQQEGYSRGSVTAQNYHRGPLVLNQIRLILGEEVFLKCLKAFATKYRCKTVNIYDFIDTINRVSGKDMTSELEGLLWSTGYASYRLAGFQSEKENGAYRTTVTIQNGGEYGLTCPLLLRMRGGEKREVFIVAGKDEEEFAFTSEKKVIGVVIDPELTTFQYHPEQKMRLWMAIKPERMLNRVWYGKSYMYYSVGEYNKAIDTITEFFSMRQKKAESTEKADKMFKPNAAYLFMRGVYYLALDDREHAEEDIKGAFPYMLDALQQGESVGPPCAFYTVGAIPEKDVDQYLALLRSIRWGLFQKKMWIST
ncbi:MAG: M1 family aminopeptidase [Planctomycetota bacterium]